MTMINDSTCELFNEKNLDVARQRLKNKTKKDLSSTVNSLINLAKKAVTDPNSLTEQERIFHEKAMRFNRERDAPNVKFKTFSEWTGKSFEPVHLKDIQSTTIT